MATCGFTAGKQKHGDDRDRSALLIGAEVLRHAPHSLRHNGDGHDLQTMQDAERKRAFQPRSRHGEREKDQSRWKCEGEESRKRAEPSRSRQTKRKANLA